VFCLGDEPGVHRVWLPDQEAPGLAMSRAFGDYCVKDHGVISTPEVTQRRITARDKFVILATDGVSKTNQRCFFSSTLVFIPWQLAQSLSLFCLRASSDEW
jgi:serine/threonine protein phosphatase PrpC